MKLIGRLCQNRSITLQHQSRSNTLQHTHYPHSADTTMLKMQSLSYQVDSFLQQTGPLQLLPSHCISPLHFNSQLLIHIYPMDASCTQVKKLRPYGTEDFKIFVRVERLWEVSQLGKSTQPSLSMILIDKEGDPIHAVVPPAHFDAYKNQLREKQVVTLSNFLVESKDKNYCPLNKLFKIKFSPNTHIEEGNPEETFPQQKFTLTDFKDLPTKVGQTAQLLDIAGLLIRVEKKGTTLKNRAGDSPKQDLFLRNERCKIISDFLQIHSDPSS